MTPQEQPDSQAGDEQTETELDAILRDYMAVIEDLVQHVIVERNLAYEPKLPNGEQLKAALEAWSRQQTAQILDKLLEQTIGKAVGVPCVPVAAIAALRVGLEGRQ